jgi:hypothetical protein
MYNGTSEPQTRWQEFLAHEDPLWPYFPWASLEEYQLVEWLSTSGLSQDKIDKLLDLAWVSFS